jgi:hypothetical protein
MSKIKILARTVFLAFRMAASELCPHMSERGRVWVFYSLKITSFIMEASPSCLL